ncbi:hypothetical protein H1C71_018661 [Ictidomys tridecemlineatus]|nr:hypothetical protein H1C71_018661 [Ictidomys tridecemlineatus]
MLSVSAGSCFCSPCALWGLSCLVLSCHGASLDLHPQNLNQHRDVSPGPSEDLAVRGWSLPQRGCGRAQQCPAIGGGASECWGEVTDPEGATDPLPVSGPRLSTSCSTASHAQQCCLAWAKGTPPCADVPRGGVMRRVSTVCKKRTRPGCSQFPCHHLGICSPWCALPAAQAPWTSHYLSQLFLTVAKIPLNKTGGKAYLGLTASEASVRSPGPRVHTMGEGPNRGELPPPCSQEAERGGRGRREEAPSRAAP